MTSPAHLQRTCVCTDRKHAPHGCKTTTASDSGLCYPCWQKCTQQPAPTRPTADTRP